jgi:hypothetical protein
MSKKFGVRVIYRKIRYIETLISFYIQQFCKTMAALDLYCPWPSQTGKTWYPNLSIQRYSEKYQHITTISNKHFLFKKDKINFKQIEFKLNTLILWRRILVKEQWPLLPVKKSQFAHNPKAHIPIGLLLDLITCHITPSHTLIPYFFFMKTCLHTIILTANQDFIHPYHTVTYTLHS